MSPALIVPMNVCAYVVGEPDVEGVKEGTGTKDFARLSYHFDQLSVPPYLGASVTPEPFESVGSDWLPAGVHLHWAVPAALSHGTAAEGSEDVDFAIAPNRWLVARIAAGADGSEPISLTAWIVESDRQWDGDPALDAGDPNRRSRPVPVVDQDGQTVPRLGRVTALADWQEVPAAARVEGDRVKRHTAIGFGIPTFSSAYPHAPNVFGLWDGLTDRLPAGVATVGYLVAGWHSDPADDPLSQLQVTADTKPADALAAATGWTLAGRAIPPRSLCAGAVVGVPADLADSHFAARSAPVDVAVGSSGAEAFAALLAHRDLAGGQPPAGGDAAALEFALALLQEGLLERLHQPGGGLDHCRDQLHTARFEAVAGGRQWTLERSTPATDPSTSTVTVQASDLSSAARESGAPLPPALAAALDELNDRQAAADLAERTVAGLRSQLYADWCKYMEIAYGRAGSTPTADDAQGFLNDEMAALDQATSQLAQARADADAKQRELAEAAGSGWVLSDGPAPRFWQPVEPVALLAGPDLERPDRYGRAGQVRFPFTLAVRSDAQLVSSLSLQQPSVTLAAGDLPAAALAATPFAPELGALLAETMLLDPSAAPALAALAARKAGSAPSPALTAAVTAAQAAASAAGPPELAFARWAQPWIPLMLEWEIEYTPDPGANGRLDSYPAGLLDDYRLDPTAREMVAPATAQPAAATQMFAGKVLLSGNVTLPLRGFVKDYLTAHPDDPDAEALRAVDADLGSGLLAQALSGLGAAFLMREQTLQLPVDDPAAHDEPLMREFSRTEVAERVAEANDLAVLPGNAYTPLRAGTAKLSRLRVVDAFGQVRELPKPLSYVRAASATPPHGTDAAAIWLPPRLQQGARLMFRWISATGDVVESSHPATSPVCGFLLFNSVDDSLALYDADGTALGSLNVVAPRWRNAPKDGVAIDQPIDQALAAVNAHLRAFALSIYERSDGSEFLQALLDSIDATLTNVATGTAIGAGSTAALVGRPLALVRASLDLELLGSPALDQSWEAFAAAVSSPGSSRREAGILGVEVAVQLGDLNAIDDGLVGYFHDADYGTFLAPAAPAGGAGVRAPAPADLVVRAAPDVAPALVTMIVDPAAGVHATTGLLPRKRIAIPPAMYAPALRSMSVSFEVTPALAPRSPAPPGAPGGTERVAIPVPPEPGFAWSWATLVAPADAVPGMHVDLAAVDGTVPALGAARWSAADGWLVLRAAPPSDLPQPEPAEQP
jgi:hypothetical protein